MDELLQSIKSDMRDKETIVKKARQRLQGVSIAGSSDDEYVNKVLWAIGDHNLMTDDEYVKAKGITEEEIYNTSHTIPEGVWPQWVKDRPINARVAMRVTAQKERERREWDRIFRPNLWLRPSEQPPELIPCRLDVWKSMFSSPEDLANLEMNRFMRDRGTLKQCGWCGCEYFEGDRYCKD